MTLYPAATPVAEEITTLRFSSGRRSIRWSMLSADPHKKKITPESAVIKDDSANSSCLYIKQQRYMTGQ